MSASGASPQTISIHAPREGGDRVSLQAGTFQRRISIHAPREGGDLDRIAGKTTTVISIHAPREGGDQRFCLLVY